MFLTRPSGIAVRVLFSMSITLIMAVRSLEKPMTRQRRLLDRPKHLVGRGQIDPSESLRVLQLPTQEIANDCRCFAASGDRSTRHLSSATERRCHRYAESRAAGRGSGADTSHHQPLEADD